MLIHSLLLRPIMDFEPGQQRGGVKAGHDQVGRVERLGRTMFVGHAHGHRPGAPCRCDPRGAVFQNHHRPRRNGESLDRQGIDFRIGLAQAHVFRGQDEREPISQPVLNQQPFRVRSSR